MLRGLNFNSSVKFIQKHSNLFNRFMSSTSFVRPSCTSAVTRSIRVLDSGERCPHQSRDVCVATRHSLPSNERKNFWYELYFRTVQLMLQCCWRKRFFFIFANIFASHERHIFWKKKTEIKIVDDFQINAWSLHPLSVTLTVNHEET